MAFLDGRAGRDGGGGGFVLVEVGWNSLSSLTPVLVREEGVSYTDDVALASQRLTLMLEPGHVIDRFTVESVLGRGGMATVYRVRHNGLGSIHALKVLSVHGATVRERLVQEGRVQASLRHPHVVAVTDVIDVDGAPGLIMEFVAGASLDHWLATRRPTPDEAARLFDGVLAGVAQAHRVGLVHRDLKPPNILIQETDEGPFPKVADFGLAKIVEEEEGGGESKTRSGIAMGTPAYMSPEQIRDTKSVDRRADIFALGCILYELYCGRPAFVGPDMLSIFNAISSGRFIPPVDLAPGLPSAVRTAIEGCLAVDRERRVPDCATLRRILAGEPWSPPGGPPSTTDDGRAEWRSTSSDTLAGTWSGEAGGEASGEARSVVARAPPERLPSESTAWPRAPLWKHLLWWALTLPVPVALLVAFLDEGGERFLAALSPAPESLVVVIGMALPAALVAWSLFAGRLWSRGSHYEAIHGRYAIVAPALIALLVAWHHTRFVAALDSAMLPVRAYALVNDTMRDEIHGTLVGAMAGYFNAGALDLVLVAYLSMMGVLAFVFVPRGVGVPALAWGRLAVVPVGIGMVGLAYAVWPEDARSVGMLLVLACLSWGLTALAVVSAARATAVAADLGPRALMAGVATMVAMVGMVPVFGFIAVFEAVARSAAEEKKAVMVKGFSEIQTGGVFAVALLSLLMLLLVGWLWHGLSWSDARSRATGIFTGVATITLTAVPVLSFGSAISSFVTFFSVVELTDRMVPASLRAGAPAALWVDSAPERLRNPARALCERLREPGAAECDDEVLLTSLAGGKECDDQLRASLAGEGAAPCLTAIEAQIACDVQGKRLPTPEEWARGIGAAPAGGDITRSDMGEWTMGLVHGVPVFEVAGGDDGVPANLAPSAFSPRVVFRCVFRYEELPG